MRRALLVVTLAACHAATGSNAPTHSPELALTSPEPAPAIAQAEAPPGEAPPREAPPREAPPNSTAPSRDDPPDEPPGVTPPPVEPDLAELPVDVRVASTTALAKTHRRDCSAFARKSRCELVADLDGDGKKDRAFKIRNRTTRETGVAIAWTDGSVSIIGAGVPSRQLATDVLVDGVELTWREAMSDLGGDADVAWTWGIAPRSGDGLRRRVMRKDVVHPAPGVTGDGIWLDGGDAVEILYWDGTRWRWLVLGF